MNIISKPSIKKFAKTSLAYGLFFALLFLALFIVALCMPKTASASSVAILITGDMVCFLLCCLLVWHYCFTAVYEIEKDGDKIVFRSLLKKREADLTANLQISAVGSGFRIKSESVGTVYLYNSLMLLKDLFTMADIETIKSWTANQE